MMRVRDLEVGDEIILNGGTDLKSCAVIVREVRVDEGRVRVSKPMAKNGHGLFSVPFISAKYEDGQNRVCRVTA